MPVCSKCKEEKVVSFFSCYFSKFLSRIRVDSWCLICRSRAAKLRAQLSPERTTEIRRKTYFKHKEKRRAATQKWVKDNAEKNSATHKKWLKANLDNTRLRDRAYRERNRLRIRTRMRKWARKRYKTDPIFRLLVAQRNRTRMALRGSPKAETTVKLFGCSEVAFRKHLENKFQRGMSWDTYGSVWHVDHIRPCSSFDLSDPAQQKRCFHYSNLQPLFVEDNLRKGDKFVSDK